MFSIKCYTCIKYHWRLSG